MNGVLGMQQMDQSLVNELWHVVLGEVDRIKRVFHRDGGGGTSRSAAMAHADGRTVSCILDVHLSDGSYAVYHVKATKKAQFQKGPEISVSYDKYYHDNENFWEGQLNDRSNAVVIDNKHYRIGPEDAKGSRGHGGSRFVIEFNDETVITTTNLWYQGVIPPGLRHKFPNTARFQTR